MIEYQKAVLICVYLDEKLEYVKLDELTPDLFPDLENWYKPIIEHRKAGCVNDEILTPDKFGLKIWGAITLFNGSLSCYPDYLKKLKEYFYKIELRKKIENDKITTEDLQKGIQILNPQRKDVRCFNLTKDLDGYLVNVRERMDDKIERYEWGMDFLEREIGRIRLGKLIVLKGLRKFGKTSFSLRAFYSLHLQKVSCVFLSTEMFYYDLIDKLAALVTRINSFNIYEGRITEDQYKRIEYAVKNELQSANSQILLCTDLTMDYIKKKIEETKCKVLFIDYLQMLSISNIPNGMNHAQVLGEMAKYLKYLCLEKNITIIALSQVNNDGDVKDCKAFEEKADMIFGMHERKDGIDTPTVSEIDFSILFRNGRSLKVPIIYHKTYGDFTEDSQENNMLTADEKKLKWMQN